MSAESTPAPQPGPFWREHQARALLALRELLTPAVLRDIRSSEPGDDLVRALRRLRRLQSDQTEKAIWCHRVLARAAREALRTLGWVDPRWTDALRSQAGAEPTSGRGRRRATTRDLGGVARNDCPARRAVEYELGRTSDVALGP
jgi:hypothetical protein